MWLYKIAGFCFVALGILGVVLPLLPTTPFLLIAAACFAKSSERWHTWLLANRFFGPVLQDWEQRRCIDKTTKLIALLSIIVFGFISVFFLLPTVTLQVITIALLAVGMTCVLRLKTCPDCNH